MMDSYCFEARNLLRAQIAYKGVTLTKLAELLSVEGGYEETRALSAKVNRGKFSMPFFLRCMKVLGMDGGFVFLPKHEDEPQLTRKPAKPAKVTKKGTQPRAKKTPNREAAKVARAQRRKNGPTAPVRFTQKSK